MLQHSRRAGSLFLCAGLHRLTEVFQSVLAACQFPSAPGGYTLEWIISCIWNEEAVGIFRICRSVVCCAGLGMASSAGCAVAGRGRWLGCVPAGLAAAQDWHAQS